MASRTPNENKALRWYVENNGLRPQLSSHPYYYFTDTAGEQKRVNILHIVADWERWRKDEKRAKHRG